MAMLVERKTIKNENGTVGYYESVFDSSNILKTTYFPNNQKLFISFNRGGTYSYSNVSFEMFELFENAESQGKFFASNIKKNPTIYPYRKEFTLYPSELMEIKKQVETKKSEDIEEFNELNKPININVEEYENIIEVLTQALNFYANQKNYEKSTTVSKIELDNGEIARQTLNTLKINKEKMKLCEDDFKKILHEYGVNDDEINDMKKIIEDYKNMGEENDED